VDEQGEPKRPDLIGQVIQGEISHAKVKPLDVSGIASVLTGVIAWAVAFVVLLVFFRDDLERADKEWWLWVTVAGFGLGLIGLYYCKRRWAAIKRDQEAAAAAQASDDSSSS
jgi:ABC-type nickel/cobalt efflux system permease component RcnA